MRIAKGPYNIFSDRGIVFLLWDWQDERRYTFHLFVTRETSTGWANMHGVSEYRAVLRDEIMGILASRGFTDIRWLFPSESGFYQPIVIAKASG